MGVSYALATRDGRVDFRPDEVAAYHDHVAEREREHTGGPTPRTDRKRELATETTHGGRFNFLSEKIDLIKPALSLPHEHYPGRSPPGDDSPVYGADVRLLRDAVAAARDELVRREPHSGWALAFDCRWLALVEYAVEHDMGVCRL